jgi:hypothetical protein
LLCSRGINKQPFLGNGLVNTPIKIEELLKAAFSVGSAPMLYNEDPRPEMAKNRWQLQQGILLRVTG